MTQPEAIHELAAVDLVREHFHRSPRGAVVECRFVVVPCTRAAIPVGVSAIELRKRPAEPSPAIHAESPQRAA